MGLEVSSITVVAGVEGSSYRAAGKQRNNELAFPIIAHLMCGVPSCGMICSTLRACSCPWVHPLLNHPCKTYPELGFLNLLGISPSNKLKAKNFRLLFIVYLFPIFYCFRFILLLFSCHLCRLRSSCLGFIFNDWFHDYVAFPWLLVLAQPRHLDDRFKVV